MPLCPVKLFLKLPCFTDLMLARLKLVAEQVLSKVEYKQNPDLIRPHLCDSSEGTKAQYINVLWQSCLFVFATNDEHNVRILIYPAVKYAH